MSQEKLFDTPWSYLNKPEFQGIPAELSAALTEVIEKKPRLSLVEQYRGCLSVIANWQSEGNQTLGDQLKCELVRVFLIKCPFDLLTSEDGVSAQKFLSDQIQNIKTKRDILESRQFARTTLPQVNRALDDVVASIVNPAEKVFIDLVVIFFGFFGRFERFQSFRELRDKQEKLVQFKTYLKNAKQTLEAVQKPENLLTISNRDDLTRKLDAWTRDQSVVGDFNGTESLQIIEAEGVVVAGVDVNELKRQLRKLELANQIVPARVADEAYQVKLQKYQETAATEKISPLLLVLNDKEESPESQGKFLSDLIQVKPKPKTEYLDQSSDEKGNTLLHWFAKRGDVVLMKQLIENISFLDKEDFFNQRNGEGDCALHLAVQSDSIETVKLLLEKGFVSLYADVNIQNRLGKTPLDIAIEQGKEEIAELLKGEDAKRPNIGEPARPVLVQPMVQNVEKKTIKASYKSLIGRNLTVDENKNNLLHLAVETGDVDFLSKQLKRHITFEQLMDMVVQKNKSGKTPLDLALDQGHFSMFKLLLSDLKKLMKSNEVHACLKKSASFQALPKLFKRYLLDSEAFDVTEEYRDLVDRDRLALLAAVKDSNAAAVVDLFDRLEQEIKVISNSKRKKLLRHRIITLVNAKNEAGQSLLDQLVTRAEQRQLAKLQDKEETSEEKQRRLADTKIAEVLIRYVPAEKIPKAMGFYHFFDTGSVEESRANTDRPRGVSTWLPDFMNPYEDIIDVYERKKPILDMRTSEELNTNKAKKREERELGQGADTALAMSKWLQNNQISSINKTNASGNTVLHLAIEDNVDVVVAWLLPTTLTDKAKNFLDDISKKIDSKVAEVEGAIAGGIAGAVSETVMTKVAEVTVGLTVGVAVTAATTPFIGPFSVLVGGAAGMAAAKAAGAAAGKIAELIGTGVFSQAEREQFEAMSGKVNVNQPNHQGDTLLHLAVRNEHKLWIVLRLLPFVDDVNAANRDGETPLHVAVRAGNKLAAEALIKAKAAINQPNRFGETPLHLAVQMGNDKLFKLLIDNGADLTAKTKLKQTPIDLVEMGLAWFYKKSGEMREAEMKKLGTQRSPIFIENNIDLTAKTKLNQTPTDSVKIKSTRSREKPRAFGSAEEQKIVDQRLPYVKMTSRIKTQLKLGKLESTQPLPSKAEQKLQKRWDRLEATEISQSQKPATLDASKNTLLHVALECGDVAFVKSILNEKQVDLNAQNGAGDTLLHLAARAGYREIIELLLAKGASTVIKNSRGEQPHEIATRSVKELFEKSVNLNKKDFFPPIFPPIIVSNKSPGHDVSSHASIPQIKK